MDMALIVLGLAGFVTLAAVLQRYDPAAVRGRAFAAELGGRAATTDAELYARQFAAGEAAADVPGRVRAVLAARAGYPADKLLADDDVSLGWGAEDGYDLMGDLERAFGVRITPADAASVAALTVRGVARLVDRKTRPG